MVIRSYSAVDIALYSWAYIYFSAVVEDPGSPIATPSVSW